MEKNKRLAEILSQAHAEFNQRRKKQLGGLTKKNLRLSPAKNS